MEYERSPIKIVVRQAVSKGLVKVIPHTAYIYRQSEGVAATPKPYWAPSGLYYVRWGGFKFPVVFERNIFVLYISVPDFLVMLALLKDKKHHVANDQTHSA